MASSLKLTCPHCPSSFFPRGPLVHIGRMHKDAPHPIVPSRPVPPHMTTAAGISLGSPAITTNQTEPGVNFDRLASFKGSIRVLRHIPKGARNTAAGSLCELINKCVETNSIANWYALLSFAYTAFRVPERGGSGSMTSKVKNNIESARSCFPDDDSASCQPAPSVIKAIESKVFGGDLRGATRLLLSDDSFANFCPETLASLQSKHPSPSRLLSFPTAPDNSTTPLTVKVEEVTQALSSFYNSSAAGLDGIRPGHLKELCTGAAGENGPRLLASLTGLCNYLLSGQLNPAVCPYLYGASLCALTKRDGGIRPIAIGSVFRRLTAKLGCGAVREKMASYLRPHQLGFGTKLGCEAAIHATRLFAMDPVNAGCVILKLDVRNAFNSLERDTLLSEAKDKISTLYPFLHQLYHSPSNLFYNQTSILSQVGVQQGDPLGPLIFSLSIQKILMDLESSLNVWYLDDGTIGGKPEAVERDLLLLIPRLKELGLEVNTCSRVVTHVCEFFPCSQASRLLFPHFEGVIPGLKELDVNNFFLLGSPIFPAAIPQAIETRKELLLAVRGRLNNLSAHVALILFQTCFAIPKITYLLRTTPTWLNRGSVLSFDGVLKSTLESVLNVSLSEDQWSQAALPIRLGGLGVRRVRDVGLLAFLASAHGAADLVASILAVNGDTVRIPFASDVLEAWSALGLSVPTPQLSHVQRQWDNINSDATLLQLVGNAAGADLARLKAVSKSESGAWLQALPSPHLGTLLDNDSLRVAVAFRLGCDVCEPHQCICGSIVKANGHHALSCCRCSGRFPRHHALNDIVRRALVSANVPCVLEPPGLCRTDGKRPDGLTLVPWQNGKCLLWDATCASTFAPSHLNRTTRVAGAAAESAAAKKRAKYAPLLDKYLFVPLAVETTGCWSEEAKGFVRDIGRRLRERGCDPRSGAYLVQRLSIAIQRGNAASVMGTFGPGATRELAQPDDGWIPIKMNKENVSTKLAAGMDRWQHTFEDMIHMRSSTNQVFKDNYWAQNGFDELRRYVKQGSDFSKELSSILQERVEAELYYSKCLAKLGSKLGKACRESVGSCAEAWKNVAMEMEKRAEIHRNYSNAFSEDLVKPMKIVIENQLKLRKKIEGNVDKTTRALAEWRAVEAKNKKLSHTAARENEKLQDTNLESSRSMSRSSSVGHIPHHSILSAARADRVTGAPSERDNAKLKVKKRKTEDAVKKTEVEYYNVCVLAERSRLEWETCVVKGAGMLESLEEERLNQLKTAADCYLRLAAALPPQLAEATNALVSPISNANANADMRAVRGVRAVPAGASEQLLPDFYCEHTTLAMNKERRKQALMKILQLAKRDIDRERKSKQGLEKLSMAIQQTPTFGNEDSQQNVADKLYHMRSMLTYLEAIRCKITTSLNELDSRPSIEHPLSSHINIIRDKQGLQHSILKVPPWLQTDYQNEVNKNLQPNYAALTKSITNGEERERRDSVFSRASSKLRIEHLSFRKTSETKSAPTTPLSVMPSPLSEPDLPAPESPLDWSERGTGDGLSNQHDSDFDEFSSQSDCSTDLADMMKNENGDAPAQPKIIGKCRALYDYTPRLNDELSLSPGDIINIHAKQEDGWWCGDINGSVGIFPATYVEEITTCI